jgi:WD40 repeat protein
LLSLDCKSILKLSQTCKQFHRLCHKQHQYLWQTLFQSDYYKEKRRKLKLENISSATFYDLYKDHFELDKRWKYGQVNTRYLTGHEDSVYCLVWVGKNRIVSGSRDRSIKLWDLEQESSSCILTKVHHEGSVLCLRVSTDMSFLVSGSSDTTCLIWSLPDFTPQNRLTGHSGGVLDVCIIGNSIVSSSRDASIRVWDRLTGNELRRLVGHAGPVNALGSHQGRVVSASGDTTLKLWDIETGDCLKTFVGHTRGLACVRFDGKYIYSGGQDNKLKVWDVNTGKCVSTLAGHSDLIRTIDSFEVKYAL